jgi:Cu-Zn family superoxide dismutase
MIEVKDRWIFLLLCAALLVLPACEREKAGTQVAPQAQPAADTVRSLRAAAELQPTAGNRAFGTVTFSSRNGEVRIVAELEGLEPGRHGFHIHAKGDCSAADGTSAGGHFNPHGTAHGAPDNPPGERHVGDLGNLEAAEDGTAHYQRSDRSIALDGPDSILGKAVIVHALADDLTSQPTGNAGARLACGVIRAAQ